MYEEFFGFRSRPFASAPSPASYFPAAGIEHARQTLQRVIERGEGPGLVIGPPGTGKTLLCHLLAEKFGETFAVALLSGGRLKTCQALLQAVHYELKLPYRGMDEGELRLSLMDFLEPTADGPEGLLLLVDEAHTLGWRLLDEIRLITNLVRDGAPRVRVVLIGGPSLEERFASPKLASFAQRLAARCYLEHYDRGETSAYVRAHLAAAGGDPAELVDEETLRSVFRATDGIPRLINQVCDHALVLAALGGHDRLSCEAIDESWADLQQLPVPWCDGAPRGDVGSQIVEFGQLSDEVDALPEAIPFRGSETSSFSRAEGLHLATPEEQLDAIDEQLSEIVEEETVSASTEVDLDFPEFGDPFGEEFAEEEVVLNRYNTQVDVFSAAPRVSSWEGRQIGSLLPPLSSEEVWTRNRVVEHAEVSFPAESATPEEDSQDDWELLELDLEAVGEEELPEITPSVAAPPASAPAGDAFQPILPPSPAAKTEERPQVAKPSSAEVAASIAGQRAKIVVEESAPVHAIAMKPKRSEFRQLFSKLRRG